VHRPLSEREIDDWERWSGRDISWKGSDIARLIATIRLLQSRLDALEHVRAEGDPSGQPPEES
jgi:hypothetical protein